MFQDLSKRGAFQTPSLAKALVLIILIAVVASVVFYFATLEPAQDEDDLTPTGFEAVSFNSPRLNNGFEEGQRVVLRPEGSVSFSNTDGNRLSVKLQHCADEDINIEARLNVLGESHIYNPVFEKPEFSDGVFRKPVRFLEFNKHCITKERNLTGLAYLVSYWTGQPAYN